MASSRGYKLLEDDQGKLVEALICTKEEFIERANNLGFDVREMDSGSVFVTDKVRGDDYMWLEEDTHWKQAYPGLKKRFNIPPLDDNVRYVIFRPGMGFYWLGVTANWGKVPATRPPVKTDFDKIISASYIKEYCEKEYREAREFIFAHQVCGGKHF